MTYFLITLALMAVAVVLWAMVCFSYVTRQHERMAHGWENVNYALEARHEIYRRLIAFCQTPVLAPLRPVVERLHQRMEDDKKLPWDDIPARAEIQRQMRLDAQEVFEAALKTPNLPQAALLQEMATDLTHADQQLSKYVQPYNKTVTVYNRLLQTSPNHLWAANFGYVSAPIYEI